MTNTAVTHICKPHKATHRPKLAKECACPTQKEFQNIFSLALKKLKHPTHKPTMQTAYTYSHDNWTTEKEAHAHNKGLAEMAGEVVKQTVVLIFNIVLGDSEVLRMPPLRQAPNR